MKIETIERFPIGQGQMCRIAESGVVGVVLWDLTGRIHEANTRFLEMVGYDAADVREGRLDWPRLTPPQWHERDAATIERLRREGIARAQEREYRRRDGTQLFVRQHSTILEDDSEMALSIVVDVSEQKRAEAERQEMMEREKLARAEAEAAVRARDDILAIVSHDLRNPLNIIGMGVNLLESSLPEDRKTAQLGVIRRAVAGMNHLIEDLLDASQIAAGRLRIDAAPVDAAAICDDAVGMFENLVAAKNQRFYCEPPRKGVEVLADRDRISQVLANLIGNAHKFTPEGGQIELKAEPLEDCVRFTVSDTGPGLSSQDLPHVFDRFWQARRVRRGGVGLGLPITKGIIDAHGGRIWAESSAGVGTTFYFTLPLARRTT
jgi:PAS domain S-box-containing protein